MTAPVPTFTRAQQLRVLFALSFTIVILGTDITIVNVAVPAIGEYFNASTAELQWVLDAFNVVMAGTVLLCSGLGDRYGRKLLLCIGLGLFVASSVVAALAPTIGVLIGARAFMGLAVSMVMPASFSMLAVVFPPKQRPFAIGVWTAVGGAAIALGPVIGGVLLEVADWQAIFFVNIPVAALALILSMMFLPESKEVTGKHLDYFGAFLSIFALGGLVFTAIEGPTKGWTSPVIITAFFIGIIALAAFIWWESHTKSPMFEIRILKIPPVIAGAIAVAITYFVVFTVLFLIPQYLQYVLNFSEIEIGLALIPMGALFGILSPLNARVIKRYGTRTTLVGGLMSVVIGLVVMAAIGHWGYLPLCIGLALIGIGWAGCLAPATSVILDSLPVRLAGSGSSVRQAGGQVGGALGVAIIGSVVTVVFKGGVSVLEALPDSVQQTAERSLGEANRVAASLPSDIGNELHKAAVDSFDRAARIGFLIAATLTLLSAILAVVCVKRGSMVDDPEGTDHELEDHLVADRDHAEHVRQASHHFVGIGSWTHRHHPD